MTPGLLMFCGELCHSGYVTDARYGLVVPPRQAARIRAIEPPANPRACMYCGAHVPTRADRRSGADAPAMRR